MKELLSICKCGNCYKAVFEGGICECGQVVNIKESGLKFAEVTA